MKLITAIIVILALILPQFINKRKERKRKAKRAAELTQIKPVEQGGKGLA